MKDKKIQNSLQEKGFMIGITLLLLENKYFIKNDIPFRLRSSASPIGRCRISLGGQVLLPIINYRHVVMLLLISQVDR